MKPLPPITERQLRDAMRTLLLERADGGALIEEMALERGATRIDLALVGSRFVGFEIKSDLDGPERFFNQIHAYNRVFDEVYLVCSRQACQRFESVIPSWWGVFAADADGESCSIALYRAAMLNESRDAMSLAVLLRRDEVEAAYGRVFGSAAPARANKWHLQGELAASLSVGQLSAIVSRALRARRASNPEA
jgi:hypothetical protein